MMLGGWLARARVAARAARPDVRRFAVANLVNTIGTGLYVTGGTLYFVKVVGLDVAQVGQGLTLAAAVALTIMVPAGRLADRRGSKPVYIGFLLLQAAAMLGYLLVRDFGQFLAVAVVAAVADRGISAVVGALIHDVTGEGERVRTRAFLRSVTNVGFSIGTLAAGVALAVGTPWSYRAIVFSNAALFAATALILRGLGARRVQATPETASPAPDPEGAPEPKPARRRVRVLRDGGYVAMSLANAVLALHYELVSYVLPLWVVLRTNAPTWTVSAAFIVNTTVVILFQVRAANRIGSVASARAHLPWIGVALAATCALMAATPSLPAWAGAAVILVWALGYSFVEIHHSAVEFTFAFDLAPDDSQGEYQGAFALAKGLARAAGPALFSWALFAGGPPGWLATGAGLLIAALGVRVVTRGAQRPGAQRGGSDA